MLALNKILIMIIFLYKETLHRLIVRGLGIFRNPLKQLIEFNTLGETKRNHVFLWNSSQILIFSIYSAIQVSNTLSTKIGN